MSKPFFITSSSKAELANSTLNDLLDRLEDNGDIAKKDLRVLLGVSDLLDNLVIEGRW